MASWTPGISIFVKFSHKVPSILTLIGQKGDYNVSYQHCYDFIRTGYLFGPLLPDFGPEITRNWPEIHYFWQKNQQKSLIFCLYLQFADHL